MDAARRVVPMGLVVVKPGRYADAPTKVGDAGMKQVKVYDPKATGPGIGILRGLQPTTLPRTLQTALEAYDVAVVYTDAYAAGYLEHADLAGQFAGFQRKGVPLVHALGAAYAFHQLMVIVDEQKPAGGEPRTRIWFVGQGSSFTAFSALACATVAEKTGPAEAKVVKTIPLADNCSAVIISDATGTYIQRTLQGTNYGPRVLLRTDGLPVEKCNPITIAKYLKDGPGISAISETLAKYRAEVQAQRVGADDEIGLTLQIGERWEIMLAVKALIEGIAEHGIAEGFGKKLFIALKPVTDEATRAKISDDPKEAAQGVLKKDDEMIAFVRWAMDESDIPHAIRGAFDNDPLMQLFYRPKA